MKTYAETKRKKPFNWFTFLRKNKKTTREITKAIHRARDWITCACGVQCGIIPRMDNGEPKDKILSGHGINFYLSVQHQSWFSAEDSLHAIEKRSAILIKRIRGKKRNPSVN